MLRRSPVNREPYTTRALPRSTGASSFGQSSGSYSRSASWMSTRSPVTCARPVRIAAPLPRLRSWVTTRTVLSASWRSTSRVPSVLPSSTMHDLEVERKLDRAHAAHDLHHRVALVVDGHDDRQLRVLLPRLQVVPPALRYAVVACGRDLRGGRSGGCQPRTSRASAMSGRRCCGSSTGSGSNTSRHVVRR